MGSLPRQSAPSPQSLDVADAAFDLDAVLARVAAGEEIVLARDGVPVARLVPATAAEPQAAVEPQAAPPPGEPVEQFKALRAGSVPEGGDSVARLKALSRGQHLGDSVRALRDAGRP